MNQFEAAPKCTASGWIVLIRFAKDGEAKPLLERGEKPRIFPTEKEAWKASTESLVAYLNGSLTSTGCKTTAAKAAAEKLFIRQKGRVIPIEHRGARA
jgi:hypothetical protein